MKFGFSSLANIIRLRSFHALSPEDQKLWMKIRLFVPSRLRWFYEGCPVIPGHLWYWERILLHRVVRRYKPRQIFEVGTWYGGGSTYFIASALYENGFGVIHTIENNAKIYSKAVKNYNHYLKKLNSYVRFHFGLSTRIYPELLRKLGKVDMIFLDGRDDPHQTLSEFEMFEPYLGNGSILVAHDWCNEKMALLRPIVEASSEWELFRVLLPPKSVGFVVAFRRFI